MANKSNIPAISQYSVQFYTRNVVTTFRFTVDNHKSSKCGKKCQNYENIQDTAKLQLLIARDRTGMMSRLQEIGNRSFGRNDVTRLAGIYRILPEIGKGKGHTKKLVTFPKE